ncbi:MAG: MIP/aquaporin family protein [Solirubrobacterales bacterium]
MNDRGLAAYIAELVGTMFLTFIITSVVVLYVATGATAQFGSDFAVVGLATAFVLTSLALGIGIASGGHFNPVVTVGAAILRKIDPIDALVYVLAQLSGGVLGALLTKAFLLDEGRASDYGTPQISALLGGNLQGALVEGIGAFLLVLAFLTVTYNANAKRDWAPYGYGITLGFLVMVLGPLTGGSFNPARWFGPALVGNHFADQWVFILGPLVGAALAAVFYMFVLDGAGGPAAKSPAAAPGPAGSPPPGPPKPPA